jgi:hypothetical protein
MAFNFDGIWGVFIVLGALFVIYYIRTLYRGKRKFEDQGDEDEDDYGVGGKRKRKPRRKPRR